MLGGKAFHQERSQSLRLHDQNTYTKIDPKLCPLLSTLIRKTHDLRHRRFFFHIDGALKS
jgi:hypothetical protein